MYLNQPVLVPKAPGKITYKKKGENSYVQFETGRIYDPGRQYTIPERKIIGVQIPGRAELMLPNENYLSYFPKGGSEMTEEEEKLVQEYTEEREHGLMVRDFFEQMYFEFQGLARKKPNSVVNLFKVERINQVTGMLKEMMKGEEYAMFLEEIPEPEETENEDGTIIRTGLTYSDVAMILTRYKTAEKRFFLR